MLYITREQSIQFNIHLCDRYFNPSSFKPMDIRQGTAELKNVLQYRIIPV